MIQKRYPKSTMRNKPKSLRDSSNSNMRLRVGEVITLPIRKLGINGEGVGHVQKQVVFVDGAIPGEEVIAKVYEVESTFAKAKIIRINKRSPYRVSPECSVYEECGGCTIQHIHKRFQARLKKELIEEAFARYTSLKDLPIEPTLRMQTPWEYRNKAQLPVQSQGKQVIMGLYSAKSHRLVDVSNCKVQHPLLNQILQSVRKVIEQEQISIYDERKHRGSIRHIVVRMGFETKEVQIVLVSYNRHVEKEQQLAQRLAQQVPECESIIVNWNPKQTSLVFGDESRTIWGQDKIYECLGSLTFLLSARAFFQLNPRQTEFLYDEVKRAAALTGTETLIDAYCGVGTIGLWLADQAKRVIGMDTVPEAIADARENATLNGIQHAEYHVGAAEQLLPKWVKEGLRPDVVVVDPPRSGLGQPLLDSLCQAKIPRLIYVSCNPATLAKDSKQLLKAGYQLERVVPIDLFPQTAHIEAVCKFTYPSS